MEIPAHEIASLAVHVGCAQRLRFRLVMYKTSNCTGTSYTRVAGAGTVHAISLATVGIGTKTLSYKVSW